MIRYETVNRQKFHTELNQAGIETVYVTAIDESDIGCEIIFADGTDMIAVQAVVDAHDPLRREEKIAEFVALRDAEILAGFITNAVASIPGIQMGYNSIDKSNYQALATMLNLDPDMTTVKFMTGNHGMYDFTREEFIQVIKDAYKHESTLVYKKLSLEAQVNAATSQAELDAIVW